MGGDLERDYSLEQYSEVVIKLLDACEMQCVMCGQLSQEDRRTKISLATIRGYFDKQPLADKRVYLWGGEPLLHPELHEVIRYFKQRRTYVSINTNGFKLNRHLTQLVRDELDLIVFSLDGSDAKTHDEIRGMRGSFDRILASLFELSQVKTTTSLPFVRINFVVLPQNYRQILKVLDWCQDYGVNWVHFQLPIFLTTDQLQSYANVVRTECGCAIRNYKAFTSSFGDIDFCLLESIMRKIDHEYAGFARFHPYKYLTSNELRTYFTGINNIKNCHCDVLTEKLAIDASGRFVTCPDFPDISFGDLENGVTNPSLLKRLNDLNGKGEILPICHRCCHFVPYPEIGKSH